MKAYKVGELPIPELLSTYSKKASIFEDLHSSLISLGQLCDDDCFALLGKHEMEILKNQKVILRGTRSNTGDGLWDIPIPQRPDPKSTILKQILIQPECKEVKKLLKISNQTINVIIRKDKSKQELARYLHACCFSPTTNTLLAAIKKNFLTTWPGLTVDLIRKHLPASTSTAKGHLNQQASGLQSTKLTKLSIAETEDLYPSADSPNIKTHDVIFALTATSDKAFLDLPGRFPFCSSRGNNYLLIAYHYDANAILGVPLKNRQASTITAGWQSIMKKLDTAGVPPKLWVLDNEASNELKTAMTKKQTKYQLVPPYTHRSNAAERAIQTFKNHFKAGLASIDPEFPMTEWDRLLEQCFLTLNLLRASRSNPNLSAHAYLFGQFDFNATPLAPPGTKVVIHSKPEKRASWDPNGRDGWYIGPSMFHYRCMKCFIPKSRAEINADTLIFFPHQIPFPEVTTDEYLKQAALDIITLLTDPPPSMIPTVQAGDETKGAILDLAKLLHRTSYNESDLIKQQQRREAAEELLNLRKAPPAKSLSHTLNQLTRVIKAKQKLETSTPMTSTMHSFKHRAANHLLNHKLNQPFHKLYHIYDSSNCRLTLEKATQHGNNLKMFHIYDDNGKQLTLDKVLKGPMSDVWNKSSSYEFGRLAQRKHPWGQV